ncbi:MAG: nucleotide exchange factor GrpE [Planctomycetes bacterium]|nr:nucleotide exchange factor GrpE [Planctomycetota bacterium]
MTENNTQPDPDNFDDEQHVADETAAVGDDLAVMQKQVDELKEKLLRSVADYQNYARRTRQDASDARDQQAFEIARSLVNVLDHFDMALEVDPTKVTTESLLKGVRMVREELFKTLEAQGVKRIDVRPGDEFNPKTHEALMQEESKDLAPNHVANVLQHGYVFKERTLRPAKVSVTK